MRPDIGTMDNTWLAGVGVREVRLSAGLLWVTADALGSWEHVPCSVIIVASLSVSLITEHKRYSY